MPTVAHLQAPKGKEILAWGAHFFDRAAPSTGTPLSLSARGGVGHLMTYDYRPCFDALAMYVTASGVLQLVSPWSTSTLPMRFAAATAFRRSDGL